MSVSMSLMRAPKEKQEVEIDPEIKSEPKIFVKICGK